MLTILENGGQNLNDLRETLYIPRCPARSSRQIIRKGNRNIQYSRVGHDTRRQDLTRSSTAMCLSKLSLIRTTQRNLYT